MVNKNYARGRSSEYRCIQDLENKGYYAVRSAGSHSQFDVIAIRKQLVLDMKCIQVKRIKKITSIKQLERMLKTLEDSFREELDKITLPKGISKELWVYVDRKGWHVIVV